MARILDVAAEVRRSQNELEREFRRDESREELRERLAAIGRSTNASMSDEQLDAAIAWYYDNLHRYKKPDPSLSLLLAKLYVRRATVLVILVPLATIGLLIWYFFLRAT